MGKDKPARMDLFLSNQAEDVGWQFVSEDVRLGPVRKTRSDAIEARRIPGNDFIALIDGAVATKEPGEETFPDIGIDTDGAMAPVSPDRMFLANGRETDRGREIVATRRYRQGLQDFPRHLHYPRRRARRRRLVRGSCRQRFRRGGAAGNALDAVRCPA